MHLKRFAVNQDVLKIIALITMTIDHIARFFPELPGAFAGGLIGRTSFPIFGYLLMEHLCRRQIFGKYLRRLGFFGVLTAGLLYPFQPFFQLPLFFPFNILISFLCAVTAIMMIEQVAREKMPPIAQVILNGFILVIMGLLSFLTQYQLMGFAFLLALYFYFKAPNTMRFLLVLILSATINATFWSNAVAFVTTVFLLLGQKDAPYPRLLHRWWTFYIYYPAHLVGLASIAYLLMSCG